MLKIAKVIAAATMVMTATGASQADADDAAIQRAVTENADRLPDDARRDNARHPAELMSFLGLKPNMTIAEVNPAGGWYSRVFAPFVRDSGAYIGLEHHPDIYANRYPDYAADLRAFPGKVDKNRALYGQRAKGVWLPAKDGLPTDAESIDAVIAVRALHNWIEADFYDQAADQVWQMLKPGGVFGIVQHRISEDFEGSFKNAIDKGRWKQSVLIETIEAKGFRLVASSEMNANPRDTADYPNGVWSLPPTYDLGDKDREKYTAIGESDRMTLKFEKVAR